MSLRSWPTEPRAGGRSRTCRGGDAVLPLAQAWDVRLCREVTGCPNVIGMDAVVTTGHGKLRGTVVGGVCAFLGLSYAAPPFGRNRLRPPRPAGSWEGCAMPPGSGQRRRRSLPPGSAGGVRRRSVRPRRRGVRGDQLAGGGRRVPVPGRWRRWRQLGPAGSGRVPAVGAGQHRGVRRRPGQRHRLRRVGWGDEHRRAAGDAPGPRGCSGGRSLKAGQLTTSSRPRRRRGSEVTSPASWACAPRGRRWPRCLSSGCSPPRHR
jgi:carboxylesterase family protein